MRGTDPHEEQVYWLLHASAAGAKRKYGRHAPDSAQVGAVADRQASTGDHALWLRGTSPTVASSRPTSGLPGRCASRLPSGVAARGRDAAGFNLLSVDTRPMSLPPARLPERRVSRPAPERRATAPGRSGTPQIDAR